jgi:O-acetyl-ADP-ribose deacetylase (regulator of RNase III)
LITYLKGDATCPQAKGPKVIAHICNDRGGWGKGFVLAISKKWPEPEQYYRRWYASKEMFALGSIQLVQVRPDTWVANMIAQQGYKAGSKGPPIRYSALKKALEQLADEARTLKASIHMPKIGTGLSGGRWELIEPIITEALNGLSVHVYILE